MGSMVSMSKGGGGRAREMDDAFPEAVEAEEEFDLFAAEDGADGFHGALAAGAFQGVASPHPEDEVTPEGAHVPGSTVGWGGDEEDLSGWRLFGRRLRFG